MKRSHSNPPNAKHFESSELKELFTDPAFKKDKNLEISKERKENPCARSTGNPFFPDVEAATPTVKVVDPVFTSAGNSLMTRRITIAGGFLDIALFTANCEQLKFVLELGNFHIYYNHVLGLLITSLVLQLLVGLTFFLLGCQVIQKVNDETYSNILNHLTMGLVALITIVNIFINTFGPKGTVMARCLGAFAYPNTSGPMWMSYLNATRNYMTSSYMDHMADIRLLLVRSVFVELISCRNGEQLKLELSASSKQPMQIVQLPESIRSLLIRCHMSATDDMQRLLFVMKQGMIVK